MLAPMPADKSDPPKKSATAETPHYHGHRMRLRERFLGAGPDALSDYELLEMVLFTAQPRRDMKPLAKSLLRKFGSFAEAVHAPETLLREVDGMGEASINQLKLIAAAASRIAKGQLQQRTLLSSWNDVISYCRTSMAFADKEQFRLLFLDKRNQLIADEVQQVGTVDHTPVSAGIIRHRDHPGAQSPLRRSDAVAGRYPDDPRYHRHRRTTRHFRARPHHRRQERACESEGVEADLARPPAATPR